MSATSLVLLLATEPVVDASESLRWEAPSSCPHESQVRQRLEGVVGEALAHSSVRARARVREQDGGGFVVELSTTTRTGSDVRTFDAPRCDVLAEAVVFVVAVAVDPVALAEGASERGPEASLARTPSPTTETEVDPDPVTVDEPKPAPTVVEPPPRTTEPMPVAPADPRPGRIAPISGAIRAATSVGVGVLPGIDIGLGAAGAVLGRSFRAELVVAHGFARPARLSSPSTAGADLDQWTALARGCWARPGARVELAACGQIEGGAVRARGVGVEQARTRWSSLVALGAAVGLAVRLVDRLVLWVDVQGYGSPRRPAFGVAGSSQTLYEAPAGGFRGSVGLEVPLGRQRNSRGRSR